MAKSSDPRSALHGAFDQASKVVSGVSPTDYGRPTPCAEFDVEALLHHMVFFGQKVAAIGRPEQAQVAPPADAGAPAEGWANAFDRSRRDAIAAWEDDGVLAREHDLGWAQFPGDVVARIYTLELVAHTWDLAHATGQLGGLDPDLAEVALTIAPAVLPPAPRGGEIPFAAVVDVPADAPEYDRLAGYLGRRP